MKLWVDDERPAPDDTWNTSLTSRDATKRLSYAAHYFAYLEEVSLDHDLGGDDTGFIVLDWMIEHKIWPKVLTIHTSNPPARKRMLAAANAEAPDYVGIYVIYDHLKEEKLTMTDLTTLRLEEERLEAQLSEVRSSIEKLEGPELGSLPNKRAGFYHVHSASYECGIAYWEYSDEYDHPFEGSYRPCKKLVNHDGSCGYEDNAAF